MNNYVLASVYRDGGVDYMERNAMLLVQLIDKVNAELTSHYINEKLVKGESPWTRMHQKAGRDTRSRAVSSVRQNIESSFNWLIEHTDIQRASKVRSTKGLLAHVFGKIAAAFYKTTLNP